MMAMPNSTAQRSLPSAEALTACQRCRDQKLKCGRSLPSCTRCQKQKAICSYPAPPDRKALAAGRKLPQQSDHPPVQEASSWTSSKRGRDSGIDRDPASGRSVQRRLTSEHLGDPSGEQSDTQTRTRPVDSQADASPSGDPVPLPPRVFGLALLEVFFARIYNSSIIFHKPTLFQDYMLDTLPDYLIRAIFALASIFLRDASTAHTQLGDMSELKALAMFYDKGPLWAQAASQEVLSHADTPSLERLQATQCLQLYWFAVGEVDRARIHSLLSYRSCRLLRYNKLYGDSPETSASSFEIELRRRCFWAAWATVCIATEARTESEFAWLEAVNLPLPATITTSRLGIDVELGGRMDVNWNFVPPRREFPTKDKPFVLAEIMSLLGVWSRILLFVTQYTSFVADQKIGEITRLSNLSKSTYNSTSFPTIYRLPSSTPSRLVDEHVLLCHTIYHICQIVLHSTIVPVFSGRPADVSMPRELVQMSAESVIKNATSLGLILHQHLSLHTDPTKISPFVGYAAFVCGSVFVIYEHTRHEEMAVPKIDSDETRSLCQILDTLKLYWYPLRRLATRLNKTMAISLHQRISANSVSVTGDEYECIGDEHASQATFALALTQTTYVSPTETGSGPATSTFISPTQDSQEASNVVTSAQRDIVLSGANSSGELRYAQTTTDVVDDSWWNSATTSLAHDYSWEGIGAFEDVFSSNMI